MWCFTVWNDNAPSDAQILRLPVKFLLIKKSDTFLEVDDSINLFLCFVVSIWAVKSLEPKKIFVIKCMTSAG